MRSGAVGLQPGIYVRKHSTQSYKEVLVILEGQRSFLLDNRQALEMKTGAILFCPPHTIHDVQNTGASPLRYIFIVARAEW